MRRLARFKYALAILAVIRFSAAAQQQVGEPQIFRPVPDSIVREGLLSVVARGSAGATLLLDGAPIAIVRPGPRAITASLNPAAGRHELTLLDGKVTKAVAFFVRTPANSAQIPPQWNEFVEHPPAAARAACAVCHKVKNGEWSFQGDSLRSNCFGCHRQQTFSAAHTHEPAVIPDCQICHSPHGSGQAKHMKLPAKAACEQCHPL